MAGAKPRGRQGDPRVGSRLEGGAVLVGVTGGIGSGKSTFARLLERLGGTLVDADRVGHQVLLVPEVAAALIEVFGPQIADEQGQIVRRELGRCAFATAAGYAQLNRIVRPALEAQLWEEVDRQCAATGDGVVIVDAALIYEWDVQDRFDLIVAVDAPEPLRCRRAAARQGLSEAEVLRRMDWQLPAQEKVGRADIVVHNDGFLEDLAARSELVWRRISAQARRSRSPNAS